MTLHHPQLTACQVCPQNCGVNRFERTGFCRAGNRLKVNCAQLHHGEEPVLSGSGGSGTIFLSHCNLRCVYCQNQQISHLGWGREISEVDCAHTMLRLQSEGAHNINLVSPTQYTPHLIETIKIARERGLYVPVVWNSNAYEHPAILEQLSGLVDIYLPDFKYAHSNNGQKYSQARDYPRIALEAVREMFGQVGHLEVDESGLARRGVLVRHLVLPNGISGTRDVLQMLHENFGAGLSLSLMSQYFPTAGAKNHPELARSLHNEEYLESVDLAQKLGFGEIFIQELNPSPDWTPIFSDDDAQPEFSINHFHGRTHDAY